MRVVALAHHSRTKGPDGGPARFYLGSQQTVLEIRFEGKPIMHDRSPVTLDSIDVFNQAMFISSFSEEGSLITVSFRDQQEASGHVIGRLRSLLIGLLSFRVQIQIEILEYYQDHTSGKMSAWMDWSE